MLRSRTTLVIAILTGISLELGIHALTGRREAWDSGAYWTIGLPLALAVSVALGFLSQGASWLWTFALVPSQVATLMVRSGEIGNLWPLTVVFSSILSTPFVVAAFIGSALRRRR